MKLASLPNIFATIQAIIKTTICDIITMFITKSTVKLRKETILACYLLQIEWSKYIIPSPQKYQISLDAIAIKAWYHILESKCVDKRLQFTLICSHKKDCG